MIYQPVYFDWPMLGRTFLEKAGRLEPADRGPVALRRFVLERTADVHDTSGTGEVVEGVQFSNGKVAMTWRTEVASIVIFDSIEQALAVHGHDGRTTVRWLDGEAA